MKEMTYTKQPNCIASFYQKENIEKPEITENLDPKAILLDSLEKSTQEITGGMNEMASGVDQVNTAVNNINTLTNKNRETAAKLMSEVQKFKID